MLKVNIRKQLGNFKLDVAFETGNEIMALLGASGCGKSLTLKCIAGIEKPDEGYIELNGRVLFDSKNKINLSPQQRKVGYLFQDYALFPNMTVEENIALGARKHSNHKAVVAEIIAKLRLQGLEHKKPHQLSGGQKQRVALARILANQPEVLLLDEPFSALDGYLKWQLELELAEHLEAFPGPIILVSHDREEVFRLCHAVCVLDNGKSEAKTSIEDLFNQPETVAACLLSGCKNISNVRVITKHEVEALDWGVRLATEREISTNIRAIGIHAHCIVPANEYASGNILHCRVTRVIDDLLSTIVMLDTGGSALLCMEIGKEDWETLGKPDQLRVSIDPRHIMLLR